MSNHFVTTSRRRQRDRKRSRPIAPPLGRVLRVVLGRAGVDRLDLPRALAGQAIPMPYHEALEPYTASLKRAAASDRTAYRRLMIEALAVAVAEGFEAGTPDVDALATTGYCLASDLCARHTLIVQDGRSYALHLLEDAHANALVRDLRRAFDTAAVTRTAIDAWMAQHRTRVAPLRSFEAPAPVAYRGFLVEFAVGRDDLRKLIVEDHPDIVAVAQAVRERLDATVTLPADTTALTAQPWYAPLRASIFAKTLVQTMDKPEAEPGYRGILKHALATAVLDTLGVRNALYLDLGERSEFVEMTGTPVQARLRFLALQQGLPQAPLSADAAEIHAWITANPEGFGRRIAMPGPASIADAA